MEITRPDIENIISELPKDIDVESLREIFRLQAAILEAAERGVLEGKQALPEGCLDQRSVELSPGILFDQGRPALHLAKQVSRRNLGIMGPPTLWKAYDELILPPSGLIKAKREVTTPYRDAYSGELKEPSTGAISMYASQGDERFSPTTTTTVKRDLSKLPPAIRSAEKKLPHSTPNQLIRAYKERIQELHFRSTPEYQAYKRMRDNSPHPGYFA